MRAGKLRFRDPESSLVLSGMRMRLNTFSLGGIENEISWLNELLQQKHPGVISVGT